MEQDIATGTDEWQRREWLATADGRHNIDAGMDRAIVVRRPAHERESRAGTEGDPLGAAALDALFHNPYNLIKPNTHCRLIYKLLP